MKITNSSITMASTHHESSYTHVESVTMEAAASKDLAGAILTLSAEAEGKNHTEVMAEYQKKQQEEAEMKRGGNEARSLKQMLERMRTGEKRQLVLPEETDMKLKILRKILLSFLF